MKRPDLLASACLTAPLLALTLTTPLSADTACDATLMSGHMAQLSATHATVYTSVLINADAAEVWEVLTDFDTMSAWSTGTLQGMTGDIQDGGSVMITFIFGVDDSGAPNAMQIPHTLIYEESEMFGWSDPFSEDIGGGHDNHIYQVQACGNQTLFVQSDEVVDNPYAANFVSQLLPMYQAFNAELRAAVEN